MATLKSKVLNFVDQEGPKTFTEIQRFMFETQKGLKYNPKEHRGYYCRYLCDGGRYGKPAFLSYPGGKDKRYLVKRDNLYQIETSI